MVAATLVLMFVTQPVAVARVVKSEVSVLEAGRTTPLVGAQLVSAGAQVVTGPGGWAELFVQGVGRARLSAGSQLVLPSADRPITLLSGRAWILGDTDRVALRAGALTIRIEAGHSVVVEARAGSVTVVTRGRRVEVVDERGAGVIVEPGYTLEAARGALSPPEVGGAGLADLVAVEARHHLGDQLGVDRFLFERITQATIGFPARVGSRRRIHGTIEVTGSENGTPGSLLEDGVRPPPFFEDEVPPKGPNVEVEVGFRED